MNRRYGIRKMSDLRSPDAPLALVTRPGIDSATLAAVRTLSADLGLGGVD